MTNPDTAPPKTSVPAAGDKVERSGRFPDLKIDFPALLAAFCLVMGRKVQP